MPTEPIDGFYDITVRDSPPGRRYRVYLVDATVPTLVDTGFADTVDRLFDGVEAVGLEPERLIVTHADPDHVGGFDHIVDEYGLETWVPRQSDLATDHTPDHRYGDGDTIGPFEAVHVPGHTADHHVLVDESAGVAVMGDAVAGADLRGFPEGYLLPHAAVYAEDLGEAERNLDRLMDYSFDAALVFHGSSVPEGAFDRLDAYVNFPGKPG